MFMLVVDDFGVRYTNRSDVKRLLTTLRTKYRLTTDWTGSRNIGLALVWDYDNCTVDLTMLGYIACTLQRFDHSPHDHKMLPTPGSHRSMERASNLLFLADVTPVLDLIDKKRLQEVLGNLLYYARAIEGTMLPALGTLAT